MREVFAYSDDRAEAAWVADRPDSPPNSMLYLLETFSLVVVLARRGAEQDDLESYSSEDINDAVLVRHFGIITVNEKPLFDCFFPLR